MLTLRADYEPLAWGLTRERIGQDLRQRYSLSNELISGSDERSGTL
jgi:hypothetical protein